MFERLRQLSFFRGFSDDDLRTLASELEEQQLTESEVLFCEGDVGHHCYIILAGELEVITYLNDSEVRLGIRRAGEIIGEMALIDRAPRSATVRALTPVDLAVLHECHFTTLMAQDPDLVLGLLRDGTTHLRYTSQRLIRGLEQKNSELARAYDELKAAQLELIRLNRLEEELAVARRIQQFFLPRVLPQLPGWQIAAFSRGAQAVGGDFFDCIDLPAGRLGLIVADACGKGVPAALYVALTRSLLHAVSQAPSAFWGNYHDQDAESALTSALWLTNDYITREHDDSDMFVTLFYGVLQPLSGHLSYANAGHNPPLILDQSGQIVREMPATTLPLGIMPNQDFDADRAVLSPGDTFVGFTDGITEAMNEAGDMFGDYRLIAVLREHIGLNAKDLLETVIHAVDSFVGAAAQTDDMTMLIMQRAA